MNYLMKPMITLLKATSMEWGKGEVGVQGIHQGKKSEQVNNWKKLTLALAQGKGGIATASTCNLAVPFHNDYGVLLRWGKQADEVIEQLPNQESLKDWLQ